jgi:hypothetical protein
MRPTNKSKIDLFVTATFDAKESHIPVMIDLSIPPEAPRPTVMIKPATNKKKKIAVIATVIVVVTALIATVIGVTSHGGGGKKLFDSASNQQEGGLATSTKPSPSPSVVSNHQDISRHTQRPSSSPSVTSDQQDTSPVAPTSPVPITFFAIGDVPYSEMEACLLPFELDKLSDYYSKFIIHLGDIRDGHPPVDEEIPNCPESLFRNLAKTFNEHSPVTSFFITGDNGLLDCTNPTEAYGYWEEHLLALEERSSSNRPTFPAAVVRHENRTEMFSFMLENVLFLGQSLPGTGENQDLDSRWKDRSALLQDNWKWTEARFQEFAGVMKAVVIFGHSYEPINEDYFVALERIAQEDAYGRPPILFLEDEHFFNVEEEFLGVSNMLRIETDDTVTPMAITVDPSAKGLLNVFTYDRRCYCSTEHRPTQLVDWPSGPCSGQCEESHSQCADKETCSPEGATC